MNAVNQIVEARASALSLRASAKACTREQGALKFRLMRAAELLDAIVLLAVRGIERIEQLEQQLAAIPAGSGEQAECTAPGSHSARNSAIPTDTPIAAVVVGGVDVAPLALAARFDRLRDRQARVRIDARISRLSKGNAGDARSVGSGVSELRIDYGPGYRVYFSRKGKTIILLLCGGDKRTQQADIERAIEIAKHWTE
jgi:putative addiction module killer protein